jgi:nucleotide-binding universal stress UspA family protein
MIDELKDKLEGDNVKVSAKYNYGKNVADDVLVAAEQTKADLVVITPLVDVANKHFFVGPNSQRIINHARVPVLSVRRINTLAGISMPAKTIGAD